MSVKKSVRGVKTSFCFLSTAEADYRLFSAVFAITREPLLARSTNKTL